MEGAYWRCNHSYHPSQHHLLLRLLLLRVLQEKLVIHQLLYRHAVAGVFLERLVEEVPRLLADVHVGGNGDLLLHDFDQLFLLADLERILPHQHLVRHDAQRPNVDFLIVFVALQDLGADVEGSAAESRPHFVPQGHRPPKVAQLVHSLVQHDVLRLYVSVDDLGGVQLVDCGTDLLHDCCNFDLGEGFAALELLKELSAHGDLEDDVDVPLVIEAAVELDDVGVREKHLNLDFAEELLDDVLLPDDCLLDDLQRHHKATASLPESPHIYLARNTWPYFPFPKLRTSQKLYRPIPLCPFLPFAEGRPHSRPSSFNCSGVLVGFLQKCSGYFCYCGYSLRGKGMQLALVS